MRKRPLLIAILAVLLLVLVVRCAGDDSANAKVMDAVEEKYSDAPWFDHVKDWDPGRSTMVAKTDYNQAEPADRRDALRICKAIRGEWSPNATVLPDIEVRGLAYDSETRIDDSVETDEDGVTLARAKGPDYRCRALAP